MAIQKVYIACTPAAQPLVQAALDASQLLSGLGLQVVTPYPSSGPVKMLFEAGNFDSTIFDAIALALAGVVGARVQAGDPRSVNGGMTMAQCQGNFPLPLSGPLPSVPVTRNAALWLAYRDLGLGAFDWDGSPGVIDVTRATS